MTNYKVVEIFSSINGEGTRAGQLAVFVRMQGCNLNCTYWFPRVVYMSTKLHTEPL